MVQEKGQGHKPEAREVQEQAAGLQDGLVVTMTTMLCIGLAHCRVSCTVVTVQSA